MISCVVGVTTQAATRFEGGALCDIHGQLYLSVTLSSAAYVLSFSLVVQGQSAAAPEAPAGFDNRTNGMLTQADFNSAKAVFEERDEIAKGLGPVYNAQSCAECHQNPVTGAISQISELRAGHLDGSGNFVDAPGGSLINDRAVDASIQERVPGRGRRPDVPDVDQHARRRLRRSDQLEHAGRDRQRAAWPEQRPDCRTTDHRPGSRSARQRPRRAVRLEGSELEPSELLRRRLPERDRDHQSSAADREHVDGRERREAAVRPGPGQRGSGQRHRRVRGVHARIESAAA